MPKPAVRDTVTITESTLMDRVTPVIEADKPGRFLIRLIDEGEGSSGYYPADTLKLAETDRIFPAGLHMYLDHAAATRRGPYGERSVRDLAAVLSGDARYDPATRALVAEADIFGHDAARLKDMAPHIGVSINGRAVMGPPLPGQSKATVKRLIEAESVDFVTAAGRGGAILAILESGVVEATTQDRRDQLDRAIRAAYANPEAGRYVGVRDYDPDLAIAYFYDGDTVMQQPYTVADDDQTITLTGTPEEVRVVTTYVPVTTAGVTETTQQEEVAVSDITPAELDTIKAKLTEAIKRAEGAEAKVAEAEAAIKLDAERKAVRTKVAEATKGEHPAVIETVTELVEALIATAIPADIESRINAAIESTKKRLSGLAESRIVGFGSAQPVTEGRKRTHNAFGQPINAKEA